MSRLIVALLLLSVAAPVTLAPGTIEAQSCAPIAVMPVINWTAKGSIQLVELHQQGDCRLVGEWDASVPGLYCTGIGSIDGADWTPDACITVGENRVWLPFVALEAR